jgi:hypothetical protein
MCSSVRRIENMRAYLMSSKSKKWSHFGVKSVVLFVLALLVLSVVLGQNASAYLGRKALYAGLPPMTLTVVGADGTPVVLHETEIGNLPSYRAYGGFKNVLGNIKGLGYYTGVRFTTLCDLVGGMHVGDKLRVTASDNYTKDFTYSEVVLGEFVTYDPSTGEQVPHYQPLVPIMAYYYNDLNITDGPLRVAVVGPEGLVTNSTYWVKWSIKMEILAGSVGGLVVPTDKVAILAHLVVYAAAGFLVVFLIMTFILARRKYFHKKQQ